MAVTKVGQLLSDFLDQSKADEATKTIAFITVGSEEDRRLKMCRYLADNEDATGEEILAEARRIAGR